MHGRYRGGHWGPRAATESATTQGGWTMMWRRGRVALQPPEKVMKIHIWVAPNSTGGVLGKPAGRPRASSVELYPCGFQSHLCACAIARGEENRWVA